MLKRLKIKDEKKLLIKLSADIHRKLKIKSAQSTKTMELLINEILRDNL